jgi:hypothetical protein
MSKKTSSVADPQLSAVTALFHDVLLNAQPHELYAEMQMYQATAADTEKSSLARIAAWHVADAIGCVLWSRYPLYWPKSEEL